MLYVKYLWYVIKHKWFVMLECWKRGLIWRGITHDLSKLRPSEFIPYARHFYGSIKKGKDETGYYKPTNTGDKAFDFAWLLHQKRNDHHWQWWILPEDEGGLVVLEISDKARKEMLADWHGAGRAQGTPNSWKWWQKNNHKMTFGPETRKWIEAQPIRGKPVC